VIGQLVIRENGARNYVASHGALLRLMKGRLPN
jgi:hypothetical protein